MINDRYMELIKNEHKVSYLLFKEGKSLQPWASHQPVLIHTLNTIKEGDVLEYGMGWNSSPIMHLICAMQGRKLLSVETDEKWFNKFLDYRNESHELLRLPAVDLGRWDHELFKRKYSIAFIDGCTDISRQKFIEALTDNVDYFVVHDTEEAAKNFRYPGFSYQWDFSGFKHVYHLQKGGPASSLLSNLDIINPELPMLF